MATKNNNQFGQVSFRLHKSVLKKIKEISHLYKFDGVKKLTQTDHCSFAISWYAKTLRDFGLKPGDNIEGALFGQGKKQ
jgi:hypothetical protein